jgi:hypothetical protein
MFIHIFLLTVIIFFLCIWFVKESFQVNELSEYENKVISWDGQTKINNQIVPTSPLNTIINDIDRDPFSKIQKDYWKSRLGLYNTDFGVTKATSVEFFLILTHGNQSNTSDVNVKIRLTLATPNGIHITNFVPYNLSVTKNGITKLSLKKIFPELTVGHEVLYVELLSNNDGVFKYSEITSLYILKENHADQFTILNVDTYTPFYSFPIILLETPSRLSLKNEMLPNSSNYFSLKLSKDIFLEQNAKVSHPVRIGFYIDKINNSNSLPMRLYLSDVETNEDYRKWQNYSTIDMILTSESYNYKDISLVLQGTTAIYVCPVFASDTSINISNMTLTDGIGNQYYLLLSENKSFSLQNKVVSKLLLYSPSGGFLKYKSNVIKPEATDQNIIPITIVRNITTTRPQQILTNHVADRKLALVGGFYNYAPSSANSGVILSIMIRNVVSVKFTTDMVVFEFGGKQTSFPIEFTPSDYYFYKCLVTEDKVILSVRINGQEQQYNKNISNKNFYIREISLESDNYTILYPTTLYLNTQSNIIPYVNNKILPNLIFNKKRYLYSSGEVSKISTVCDLYQFSLQSTFSWSSLPTGDSTNIQIVGLIQLSNDKEILVSVEVRVLPVNFGTSQLVLRFPGDNREIIVCELPDNSSRHTIQMIGVHDQIIFKSSGAADPIVVKLSEPNKIINTVTRGDNSYITSNPFDLYCNSILLLDTYCTVGQLSIYHDNLLYGNNNNSSYDWYYSRNVTEEILKN